MLKRLRWLTLGAGLGVGASLWAQRRLRYLLDRYAPVRGTATVLGSARRMRRDATDAWQERRQRLEGAWEDGRRQMRDAEQRLRDERERRWAERRQRREAA
ncbi:hypothetical protein [Candidatus Poriferisodalis sp.]|uniref:hypothetical protein n=1 Tax=Candidatus Poriferisodalis sp. TaxID=3101277 RepID=UPI003B017BDC